MAEDKVKVQNTTRNFLTLPEDFVVAPCDSPSKGILEVPKHILDYPGVKRFMNPEPGKKALLKLFAGVEEEEKPKAKGKVAKKEVAKPVVKAEPKEEPKKEEPVVEEPKPEEPKEEVAVEPVLAPEPEPELELEEVKEEEPKKKKRTRRAKKSAE